MVTPQDIDPRLFRASALTTTSLEPGRLVELSGTFANATTSTAVAAVVDAQHRDDVVVWVQPQHGLLFPPDLDDSGVDLEVLVVVHVPVPISPPAHSVRTARTVRGETGSHDLPRAAELLLRSGAIDLLVLDWRPLAPPRGAWLVRLQALAREHESRVLLLTDSQQPIDAGCALVLRLAAERRRAAGSAGPFTIESRVRRDKRHAAAPPPVRHCDGPAGLA